MGVTAMDWKHFGRAAVVGPFVAAALAAPVLADDPGTHEMMVSFERCYEVSSELPGPALAYDEDVCVAYEGSSRQMLYTSAFEGGAEAVQWTLVQEGTATVSATSDGAVLDTVFFRIEEVAEDLGNDAGCLWTEAGTPEVQRASVEVCAGGLENLEQFSYSAELIGETLHRLHASGHAGSWCASADDGTSFGPGCS